MGLTLSFSRPHLRPFSTLLGALALLGLSASGGCGGRTAPGLWWQAPDAGPGPLCGNGVIDPGEECDNGAANSDTVPDACRTTCRRAACGDGVRDHLEECDTNDFGGATCLAYGYEGGVLRCTTSCSINTAGCVLCGDGVCAPGESNDTCPDDCRPGCGDGTCADDEDARTCPADCATCGDGLCSPGEDPTTCPQDCAYCGDGYCSPGETNRNCSADCPAVCGDGYCGPGETSANCPDDCDYCGDGVCGPGETSANCPDDCGAVCGNGLCESGEDQWSCPQDCGGLCGNGFCEPGEDEWSCPEDCGYCGDGICTGDEPDWCPQDCGGFCGDGYCGPDEDPDWCPEDCGYCGDGICTGDEPNWCPEDCGGFCGDGYCAPNEDPWSCPMDCGGWCGNGACEPGEDQWSCPEDCGYCGDGICTGDEPDWCPQDCPSVCGDGICGPGEDPFSCPMDCRSELSCQGIVMCTYCCAPGAQGCRAACRQSGTPTAQAEFSQYRNCLQTNCPQECAGGTTSVDCLYCGWSRCTQICHWETQGTGGCSDAMNCLGNCPDINQGGTGGQCAADPGITCQDSCWRASDAQAESLYQDFLWCVTTYCAQECGPNAPDPNACNDCITTQCSMQINACFSD